VGAIALIVVIDVALGRTATIVPVVIAALVSVGLALVAARAQEAAQDNARLFRELAEAEGQLEGVLTNLAEAVIVQDVGGRVVFANDAAARLQRVTSAEELLSLPVEQLRNGFAQYDEQGREIPADRYPAQRALAGGKPEPLLVRRVETYSGAESWLLVKATAVEGEDGRPAYAVSVVEDVTDAHRKEMEQRFLSTASKLLSSSLDVAATLDKAAWVAVPEIADWCRVDLADERGILREAAVAHVDTAKAQLLRDWRAAYPPRPTDPRNNYEVLRTGRSVVWDHVEPEDVARYAQDERMAEMMREVDTRSAIMVPLLAGDRTLGTIQMATTGDSGRLLSQRDLALAEELGRRAGIAVENARVHAARTHIATTLQRSLLPPRLPELPGLTIAARFRAAGEATDVGGDFYDIFPVRDGWMVVIGDVTGKGPDAAAITSMARYTMRTAAAYEPDPGAVLARLNQALAADTESRRLCTAVCIRLDEREGRTVATIASAGHPPPLHVRQAGAEPQAVDAQGPLLGAFEDETWPARAVPLAPGDSLVMYTDGVTDATGEDGRFGLERLVGMLRGANGLGADDIASRIDEALRAFQVGAQRDDVALLVIQAR
jgi:PAS domain S-box-containing protein